MNHVDPPYIALVKRITHTLDPRLSRGDAITFSIFDANLTFDLSEGFPLLTTKKVNFEAVKAELLWFLEGSTSRERLNALGSKIWDEWAVKGELGPIYGKQWRAWDDTRIVSGEEATQKEAMGFNVVGEVASGRYVIHREIDQIRRVIDNIKMNPMSRRHVVTAWNPSVVPEECVIDDGEVIEVSPQENVRRGNAALPACHTLFQFYVEELSHNERMKVGINLGLMTQEQGRDFNKERLSSYVDLMDVLQVPLHKLSCMVYQRSCDVALGLPFNIASYALLTHLVARSVNMTVGTLHWTGGDVHLYSDHLEGISTQIERMPYHAPTLWINPECKDLDDVSMDDIAVLNYQHHDYIPFPISV